MRWIQQQGQQNEWTYYGDWQVEKVAGHTPIYAEPGDRYIGKKVFYSNELARFDDSELTNPTYKEFKYTEQQFFELYGNHLSDIGIHNDTVSVVEVENWDNPGNILFIKNEKSMITLWDGTFFELIKK